MTAIEDTTSRSRRRAFWWSDAVRDFETDRATEEIDLGDPAVRSAQGLLLAVALMAGPARTDASAPLRLPHSNVDLEQLRRWHFQPVCERAAGRSLRRLVSAPDRARFGVPSTEPETAPAGEFGEFGEFRFELERDGFFGLVDYDLQPPGAFTRLIRSEWERWRHPLVARLLRVHPPEVIGDVARVLVHELLANAIQHPYASRVVVGSSVDDGPNGPHLSIAVWDDGRSVIHTLARVAPEALRASETPDWAAEITDGFDIVARGWEPESMFFSADWTPSAGHKPQPGELLLAALLPGVSRKHSEDDYATVDRPETVPWELRTGFGLHALYRCAIDAFGGALCIRTGDHWLRLTAAERAEDGASRYRAEIDLLDRELVGNFVSLELPLRPSTQR